MDLGYARVSTGKQDLDRQLDALGKLGIPGERIYVDKKSGSTTDRPGLRALLGYARDGDVIVVHTLDRLGRTVRDTLNLIHELSGRGIGVRNLAEPIRIDSGARDDPMAQLAVLLALFGQMERTYAIERAAHARAVATAKGCRGGARSRWIRTSWCGRRICAMRGTPWPRSWPRPASRVPACIGICHPGRRSR